MMQCYVSSNRAKYTYIVEVYYGMFLVDSSVSKFYSLTEMNVRYIIVYG